MANGWHYAQGKKTFGPLDVTELQVVLSRLPNPHNLLVWKAGFEGWQQAGNVPELAQFIHKPPPLPQPKKLSLWKAALSGGLFVLVLRLIVGGGTSDPFFPLGIAELIGYLILGVIIFVPIADIRNRNSLSF